MGSGMSAGLSVREKPVNLAPKLEAARQLFLYGDKDGVRVLEALEIAKRVGCHPSSVWRHIKDWTAEFESMLIRGNDFSQLQARANENELNRELRNEDVEKFKSDLLWVTKQTESLRKEVDNTEKIEEICYSWLKNSDISEKGEDAFLAMAEKFFSAVHTKSKLRSQWIAMEKEWVRMSGIEGKMEIVQNAEKARAIGRVKIDLKREETEQTPGLKVAKKPVGGIFAD